MQGDVEVAAQAICRLSAMWLASATTMHRPKLCDQIASRRADVGQLKVK